jgi:hypothetical protein
MKSQHACPDCQQPGLEALSGITVIDSAGDGVDINLMRCPSCQRHFFNVSLDCGSFRCGPVDGEDARRLLVLMQACPEPDSKHCRCPVHDELNERDGLIRKLPVRDRTVYGPYAPSRWRTADVFWHDVSVEYNDLGDASLAQGSAELALYWYRESLRVAERAVVKYPTNANWRDVSVSHNKVGDALRAQGDAASALAAYRAALEITERLAAQDPTNADWQRDLSVSHSKVGDVLRAQGDAAGALAAYQTSLGIAERLAAQDPTNADWQRDVVVSHNKVAEALHDDLRR